MQLQKLRELNYVKLFSESLETIYQFDAFQHGPNDNFDLKSSHVLPAMIRKFND